MRVCFESTRNQQNYFLLDGPFYYLERRKCKLCLCYSITRLIAMAPLGIKQNYVTGAGGNVDDRRIVCCRTRQNDKEGKEEGT